MEKASKSLPSEKRLPNGRDVTKNHEFDTVECIEHVASSFNIPGVSIAMAQSSVDLESGKSIAGNDVAAPAMQHIVKSRKLSTERSDPRKYVRTVSAKSITYLIMLLFHFPRKNVTMHILLSAT